MKQFRAFIGSIGCARHSRKGSHESRPRKVELGLVLNPGSTIKIRFSKCEFDAREPKARFNAFGRPLGSNREFDQHVIVRQGKLVIAKYESMPNIQNWIEGEPHLSTI